MGRLHHQVAIITGAGQGIGRGVARAFAREGAQIVIANRSRETGEAVVAEIEKEFSGAGARAMFLQTDVSEEKNVRAMVDACIETFGGVDILVNNATPTGGMARLEHMGNAAMQQHIQVNYYAAFWAMQAVSPI